MSNSKVILDFASFDVALNNDVGRTRETVQSAAADVADDLVERAQLVASFNVAIGKLREENRGGSGVMSSAENALASRLQSYLVQRAVTEAPDTLRPAPGDVLEVKFDSADIFGWLPTGLKALFKVNSHAWVAPPIAAEAIHDTFRVALFSDWGTGLYGAPRITNSIQSDTTDFDMMMHLGDTYYSGGDDEIRTRLMEAFPKGSDRVIRRTLNGNHEMYSGGKGYFDSALPFLKQPASCFAYQNANWLLIALDTAYIDHALDKKNKQEQNITNQVAWIDALVAKAGSRKVILFSHHQPFSQLDKQGPKIVEALGAARLQRVHAWFWGHEHRCVIYQPHAQYEFKGRCIGHGGFPEFRDNFDKTGRGHDEYRWVSLPARDAIPAADVLDGANKFIDDHGERYSPHGYVVLRFKGADCFEEYLDAEGTTLREPVLL